MRPRDQARTSQALTTLNSENRFDERETRAFTRDYDAVVPRSPKDPYFPDQLLNFIIKLKGRNLLLRSAGHNDRRSKRFCSNAVLCVCFT